MAAPYPGVRANLGVFNLCHFGLVKWGCTNVGVCWTSLIMQQFLTRRVHEKAFAFSPNRFLALPAVRDGTPPISGSPRNNVIQCTPYKLLSNDSFEWRMPNFESEVVCVAGPDPPPTVPRFPEKAKGVQNCSFPPSRCLSYCTFPLPKAKPENVVSRGMMFRSPKGDTEIRAPL